MLLESWAVVALVRGFRGDEAGFVYIRGRPRLSRPGLVPLFCLDLGPWCTPRRTSAMAYGCGILWNTDDAIALPLSNAMCG